MIERLTLSLVPSTVSLGIFSMIGASTKRFRLPLDGIAVIVAFFFTYFLTVFTGYSSLPPYSKTYSFLTLGTWSALFILVLSGGFLFAFAVSIRKNYRSIPLWLSQKAFAFKRRLVREKESKS
jgi:hypothetical protein